SGVNLLSFDVSTAAGDEQLSCKTLSHLDKQRTTTIYIYNPSGRFATKGRYHNAPPLLSLSSPSTAAGTHAQQLTQPCVRFAMTKCGALFNLAQKTTTTETTDPKCYGALETHARSVTKVKEMQSTHTAGHVKLKT
ncbi:unnamed protein product, partial [Ectocarpus sp. 12 AP-2014]